MSNGRFQIFLRKRQNTFEGNNVVVQCNPVTGFAEYVPGNVDNAWHDYTNFVDERDVNKITLTWDKVNTGNSGNSTTNPDGSNYDKGVSSELMFFDEAYFFIKNWLLDSECQILNAIEVKIVDLIAGGTYRIFEIKSDNIEEAPVDEPCQFHVKLREQDTVWHCIHKTFIWDNWQNWFKDNSTKTHPCFLTCIEPRPRLVSSARMALLLFYHSVLDIIFLITGVVGFLIKNWIKGLSSEDLREDARKILNVNRFVDAPLIRTYIENAAGKCGLAMDTIFDAGREWENLCLFYPQAGYMHESDDDAVLSPSLSFHFDNRWLITIAELLDKLKTVFAAEWYVTPLNTIVFKHTKDLILLSPIYDFTAAGAERIYNLRYSFNGDKKPAYGRYQYQDDGSDLASQEMSTLYSDIVDYDGPKNNPMLEGERSKNFEFAPTGFIRDGRAKDYLDLLIKDGKLGALILVIMVAVVTISLILGVLSLAAGLFLLAFFWAWVGAILVNATKLRNEFVVGPTYDGAVRLTSEQTLTPRLILWDGFSEQRAKVVMSTLPPAPNLFYNPDAVPYTTKNDISKDNPDKNLYNYPLYFDGDFWGNLFPRYHDVIDNPLKSLASHRDVKWSVDLCEGMLNLFGVFQNQYAVIGKVVKLERRDNYDVYVRIGNINVDYESNRINLAGVVLRRQLVQEQPGPPVDPGGGGIPGGGGPVEEESPSPGSPPSDPTNTICYRWTNSGDESSEVTYRDCDGIIQDATVAVGDSFCATEVISSEGGVIVASDICTEASPSESGIACYNWQNIGVKDAIGVSYTTCAGDIVTGATVPAQSVFCARSIEDFGTCGIIVNAGLCDDCSDESDTNLLRWK